MLSWVKVSIPISLAHQKCLLSSFQPIRVTSKAILRKYYLNAAQIISFQRQTEISVWDKEKHTEHGIFRQSTHTAKLDPSDLRKFEAMAHINLDDLFSRMMIYPRW